MWIQWRGDRCSKNTAHGCHHQSLLHSHGFQVLAAGGLGTASSAGVGPAFRPLLLKASDWVIAP